MNTTTTKDTPKKSTKTLFGLNKKSAKTPAAKTPVAKTPAQKKSTKVLIKDVISSLVQSSHDFTTPEEKHVNIMLLKLVHNVNYYEQNNAWIAKALILAKVMCEFLVVNDWYLNSLPTCKSHMIEYLEKLDSDWPLFKLDQYVAYLRRDCPDWEFKKQIDQNNLAKLLDSPYLFIHTIN